MMIFIIIVHKHFIYVASFNLHNSRKELSSPLQINTSKSIVMSLWNTGCYKSCICKHQDSTTYPFLTSPSSSIDKLPLKHFINVHMILSIIHEHKALKFSSICLSTRIYSQSSSIIFLAFISPFYSYSCPFHSGFHYLHLKCLYT